MIAGLSERRSEVVALCRRFGVRRLDVFGSATSEEFDPAKSDITIQVEASGDLVNWSTIASSVKGGVTNGPGYYAGDGPGLGIKQVEVRDVVNMSAASRRFLRIRVSQ